MGDIEDGVLFFFFEMKGVSSFGRRSLKINSPFYQKAHAYSS